MEFAEKRLTHSLVFKEYLQSPYPAFDECIARIIQPGNERYKMYGNKPYK